MAKIIAAEKIRLDAVTVEKNTDGKLVFNSIVQIDKPVTDSLQTRISSEEVAQSNADSTQESKIGSLQTRIQKFDDAVRVSSYNMVSGQASLVANYTGFGFTSAPNVMGMVTCSDSNDPIIVCQLRSVSNTQAIFDFSDEVSGGNYDMKVTIVGAENQS